MSSAAVLTVNRINDVEFKVCLRNIISPLQHERKKSPRIRHILKVAFEMYALVFSKTEREILKSVLTGVLIRCSFVEMYVRKWIRSEDYVLKRKEKPYHSTKPRYYCSGYFYSQSVICCWVKCIREESCVNLTVSN